MEDEIPTMSLQPIAGVDLERYVAVIRRAELANHDATLLAAMAALHGIDPVAWDEAHEGWSRRIAEDHAVAVLFHTLYHG